MQIQEIKGVQNEKINCYPNDAANLGNGTR
jgi:hypothetical protein